jgi:hypothetical protein
MGANDFSVTVEKLDATGSHLSDLSSWFAAMGSLIDASRAEAASDSPLSAGALASFSRTMREALQTTARLLQEDRVKLTQVADRYRSVDEQSARSADALTACLGSESSVTTFSVRQSQITRGVLEGLAGLDDVVVPIARTVTGASDRVQETLRAEANDIERGSGRIAESIAVVNPAAGLGILVGGAVSARVLRTADSALESGEEVVRNIARGTEDLSRRADRVLIRPTGGGRR